MITDCETCTRRNVPCSGCEESQRAICFICQGDIADPYCELNDNTPDADRLERCEEEASDLFKIATAPALTEYYATVTLISDPPGSPRYDRAREAAKRKYELTSKPAWDLRNRAVTELLRTGEISEDTDNAFTALKISSAVAEPCLQAAE